MNYENIYDYLFEPRIAIGKIKLEKPWLVTFLIVFLALFTQGVSNLIFFAPGRVYAFLSLTIFFFLRVVFVFFLWFLLSGFYHFLAEIFGGQGKFTEIFLSLGFSFLPLFFLLPWSIAARLISINSEISGLFFLFYFLGSILLILWIFRLQVLSIKGIYALSTKKAFLVFFSPFVFLTILIFLFLVLFLSSVFIFIYFLGKSI